MPIYSFTHVRAISAAQKQELASQVTKIHCETTQAPQKYVQVVFRKLEAGDAFSSGQRNDDYIALEGQIRPGRPEQLESEILRKLNDLIKRVLNPAKWFISLSRFNTPHLMEDGNLLPEA